MKRLAALLTLAMLTTAGAQITPMMPKTVHFKDADGKVVVTATFWENKITLRDAANEFIATIVYNADGRTIYDPNGKILDKLPEAAEGR